MEKELMNVPWSTMTMNLWPLNKNDDDDTMIFPQVWEENYQDLSGYCVDGFPGQCTSYIGESYTLRNSGMKIEDDTSSLTRAGDVFEQGGILNAASTNIAVKHENELDSIQPILPVDDNIIDVPNTWLDLPKSSIALRTDEWIKLVDNESVNDTMQQQDSPAEIIGVDTTKEQQIPWEATDNLDNTTVENFDLLSYLCDDATQSTESLLIDSGDFQATTSLLTNEEKPSRRRRRNCQQVARPANDYTTDEIDDEPLSKRSRRSSKAVTIKTTKKMDTINSRSAKRSYNSDSDDQSSVYSYRESREKNNEASRKSRMNKKSKEMEMMDKAAVLERDNVKLKMKVEHLEKMVTTLRSAILKSALKRSF